MAVQYKIFSRGYEFKNFEGQPQDKLIQAGIPERIIVPLRQGFGNEVAPVIQIGQKVLAGQIIAKDDESISCPIHCSVNGKVVGIEKIDYLGSETTAVTIESDGTQDWQRLEGHSSNWENLPVEKIESLIYLSGAGSTDATGIPTRFKSSVISPEEVEDVIICGVESEVHSPSLAVLLKDEKLSHFTEGIKILQKVMTSAEFHVALNKSDKNLIEKVSADNNSIDVYSLEPKYPVHYDEVLVSMLLGREFPYGYSAANIGVIVLGVQAVLQVYDAVVEGKALIEKTVALCGPGFIENSHVKVRVGTPLEHIIEGKTNSDKDLRFIRNSCLTGETLCDLSLPVDRTFDSIIAVLEDNKSEFLAFARPGFTRDSYSRTCVSMLFGKKSGLFQKKCGTNVHGELRPCIFCSFCEQVCPVGIIPHLLFHHVEKNIIDETLLKYGIFNCVECNLCSYVCPSKIPVAQFIKEGKTRLLDEGFKCPEPHVALKGVENYKSIK